MHFSVLSFLLLMSEGAEAPRDLPFEKIKKLIFTIGFKRGVHLELCVKLVFEIAVASELGPMTKLLRGSWTPTAHWCLRCGHAHIWSYFDPNHLNMPKTQILGVLLTASDLLSVYKNPSGLDKK